MTEFLHYVTLALAATVRALGDALTGTRRKTYEVFERIDAPRELVWSILTARSIRFEEVLPVEISVAPSAADPDIIEGTVTHGESTMPLRFRQIELRPPEAMLIEMLPPQEGGTLPGMASAVCASTLLEDGQRTQLMLRYDIEHLSFGSRISIPVSAALSARRIRRHAERLNGTLKEEPSSGMATTALTGVLTFLSFTYLFGWQAAAMLIVLILIHEVGHAVSMWLVGQPVRGIYFVPFMGGVAVATRPFASEGERGFVALMGPGFSVITTAFLWWSSQSTGNELLSELALMSAILNGLNLLPFLPLDGGHVMSALFSRAHRDILGFVELAGLLAGFGVALYMEWHVLTVLLALTAPGILLSEGPEDGSRPIITASEQMWLGLGFAAIAGFYVFVTANLLGAPA